MLNFQWILFADKMVKLRTFEITLASSDGLFMAGEILQGYLTVELKYPMKMQGKI